ncbi:MAG: SET domain-containing protein-lysine N-methyltransferase [Candidatus Hodarchaeales archaeon]|jgi:SET domain-containing protein
MYRPLPDGLSIKPSKIDGLGLFAIKPIKKDINLGITHIFCDCNAQIIRTPLGGFINHSKKPNAKLIKYHDCNYLWTLKDIKPMEEITLEYTMYNPEEE